MTTVAAPLATQVIPEASVSDVVRQWPATREVFDRHGLKGCGGEFGPCESLAFFAAVHEVPIEALLREIREQIENPTAQKLAYSPSAADKLYRPFFKLGIATVLTVGCMWGAINLAQIAIGKSFLQLTLLSAIHAHAHAMIWCWVAAFVMGFAYQSFPRFKNTTLWRPRLAQATFILLVGGTVARMTAELTLPATPAFWLGGFSAALEITAAILFVAILFNTARQSSQAPVGHEKFLFAAFFWFLVQSVLDPFFFFAKATAVTQDQLVMRIATIDAPLRDIQLLGFAALIIAGVSQKFLPGVYGLPKPAKDRQPLIFAVMNLSLVLNVLSYVLLLTTHNPVFALMLELAWVQIPLWAVLLVKQLRIFARPTASDRSFKFVRAAYVWLLVAAFLMPMFPFYGWLTNQMFSHAFWGAQRHALTVGFISMMILGISSRVTPILSGVDSRKLDSLWVPFVLINIGNAGRVVLQILTDFVPSVAYPLIGFTGFIEVTALAWWGIGLWRLMNHRAEGAPQEVLPKLVTITGV
jgi:hypothetical protein